MWVERTDSPASCIVQVTELVFLLFCPPDNIELVLFQYTHTCVEREMYSGDSLV